MNMNLDILNRSMYYAGLLDGEEDFEPLTEKDRNADAPKIKYRYENCKSLYLSTFLEALSEVPWTMGRRRGRLLKTRLPHGNAGCRFVYDLPYDCARPVELSDKGTYVIDGDFLCTDTEKAELLYVSNGKRIPLDTVFESAGLFGFAEGRYELALSPGRLDEWDVPIDFTVYAGLEEFAAGTEPPPPPYEDYPDYRPPQYERKFYEYLEMSIAAKLAVKNTKQPRLHDTLMRKAALVKQEAVASSRSIAANKDQPSHWWSDRLGIHLDF